MLREGEARGGGYSEKEKLKKAMLSKGEAQKERCSVKEKPKEGNAQ